jgi:hypothetical protein
MKVCILANPGLEASSLLPPEMRRRAMRGNVTMRAGGKPGLAA